ncbi:MAG: hypothetical protein R2695_05315 [Acidimicrobiales bacterium]
MTRGSTPTSRVGSADGSIGAIDGPAEGTLELTDDEHGEWLAYELHEWASESRAMLARLLLADGVSHSWQGTTLLAHEDVEAAVDALIEEVDQVGARELDADAPLVAFEMAGWPGELQAKLAERLGRAGLAYQFDADGDLVCHEADEEHVELIIEDLMAFVADDGLVELEGLAANDLLSGLFAATDRLRRDVHDAKGVLGVLEHGRRLAGSASPFGFAVEQWAALRDEASALCDLIESEDSTDEEIGEAATVLRDALQALI